MTIGFSAVLLGLAGCGAPVADPAEQAVNALTGLGTVEQGEVVKKDFAVAQCKVLWQEKFAQGEDFSSGPCLADEIITDWSCDVAHSPRQAVDEQSANQCAAYRAGQTHHFVELDLSGQLIKAQ
jgi:hypothetical protein